MRMPRRPRFRKPFYGWWIVAAAVVSQFTWMAAGPTVVGVFLNPVVDDTGWLVWQFTLGTSLAGVMGAASGVFAGQALDRHGPRPLMLIGVAASVVCFAGIAAQSSLWAFLILHAALGLVGYNLFGSLVASSAVSKWFVARRGWALAVGSVGVSLAGIIAPVAMTFAVDTWGWRAGYAALGAFVFVAVTPAAFAMRRAPEDYGLAPDGAPPESRDAGASGDAAPTPSAEAPSLDRRRAMRTSAFWLLTAGFGLNYAALSAILVHAIPFVSEAGFARTVAASALAVNGVGNLSSKVVWGYGLQRFETRRLVFAAFSTSGAGVALMVLAARTGMDAAPFIGFSEIPTSQIILFAGFFLYGFGFGGTIPISEFIWARYFGRRHIGAIRGISNPISIVGTGLGPILMGAWFDLSGAYGAAFLAAIAAYTLGAAIIGASREPARGRDLTG